MKLEFMFMKHYAPNRCEPSIEALIFRGGGGGIRTDANGEVKFGGHGRCEQRSEVFVKIQKKKIFFFFWGGAGGRVAGGGSEWM